LFRAAAGWDSPAKRRLIALEGHWTMLRLLGWTAIIAVVAMLVWQTASAEPVIPRPASGLLLVLIAGLAGIRIGSEGAAAYVKDLHRLNRVLAEQNEELQDLNATLLKQVSAGTESTTPSERA
jgi:hypothetical protein